MATQTGWRWCRNCQGLYFAGGETQGLCFGANSHDGSASAKYVMQFGEGAADTQPQGEWRWCHQCQGMHFSGASSNVFGADARRMCFGTLFSGGPPPDGQHDPSQSGHYVMAFGDGGADDQGGWRFCKKCFGLFFSGNADQGHCPSGGLHDNSQSGAYVMHFEHTRAEAEQRIQEKYAQVGGSQSPLGLPIDAGLSVQQNGQEFFTDYHGGHVVFTEGQVIAKVDTQVVVIFKGIHCFGKSEAVDEPYAIVGVYALHSEKNTVTTKFPKGRDSYTDFVASTDASEASIVSPDETTWSPQNLVIVSTVMEHDSGDPDRVAAAVEEALKKAAKDAGVAADDVSTFTGILDDLAIPGLFAGLLGVGDDLIGSQVKQINLAELIPKPPMQTFGNIEFNFESPLLSDGDASYKLFYEVFVQEIQIRVL